MGKQRWSCDMSSNYNKPGVGLNRLQNGKWLKFGQQNFSDIRHASKILNNNFCKSDIKCSKRKRDRNIRPKPDDRINKKEDRIKRKPMNELFA